MTQQERILKLAQERITYIGHRGRNWSKTFTAAFEFAIKFTLDNLWISIKEDMPKEDNFYLCKYYDDDDGLVYYEDVMYFDTKRKLFDTIDNSKITHWMPIPALNGGEK